MGKVDVAWILSSDVAASGPPTTCEGIAEDHQVQVQDGAGTVLAIAEKAPAATVESRAEGSTEVTRCSFDYTASVAPTGVITVALVGNDEDGPLDSQTFNVDATEVRAPDLAARFLCSTGSNGCGYR